MAKPLPSPRSLARASALHPWRTILTWVAVLAAITVLSSQFAASRDNDDSSDFTGRPESIVADDLIGEHFPSDDRASENLVVHSGTLTVDDPGFREVVDATLANLRPFNANFASVTNY